MKISVVTPSFNQADFLPFNLASVAAQSHTDFEHIVVDPGSTDGSVEIARAAEGVQLIHEPDKGQSDGISKGFAAASGDILAWLNSDDTYATPKTLEMVAKRFMAADQPDVVYGNVDFVDRNGAFLRAGYVNSRPSTLLETFQYQVGIVQPGVFFRREVFETLGGPSSEYHYCMDYEYWVRMTRAGYRFAFLREVLAHHRWWSGMKTSAGRGESYDEHCRVCREHFGFVHEDWIHRYAEYLYSRGDGIVNSGGVPKVNESDDSRTPYSEIVRELYLYYNGCLNTLRLLTTSTNPLVIETKTGMEGVVGMELEVLKGCVGSESEAEHETARHMLRRNVAAADVEPPRFTWYRASIQRIYWALCDLFRASLPGITRHVRKLRRHLKGRGY